MNEKILCVDDDPNILEAYQRTFRKRFELDVALGGEEALAAIFERGPYAVVVADMRMPGMNGVELLKKVMDHSKDTVRMMLTGNADQQTALEAVNEGHIFRFITKPCPPQAFAKILEAGLEQYRLVRAERDLLSKTFSACVKVLTDILSTVSPTAFGRASRVRQTVRLLCRKLDVNDWQVEVAAMLSHIGCVSIPESILVKAFDDIALTPDEQKLFESYPRAGQQLIANIPRLEDVTDIVAYQQQHYDGGGFPGDGRSGEEIPLGSRLLKVALDFDTLMTAGYTKELALAELNDRAGWYDPTVLSALSGALAIAEAMVVRRVKLPELIDGFVLAENITASSGVLVLARGQEINRAVRMRLRNFSANTELPSMVRIFVPLRMVEQFSEQEPEAVGK